MLEGIKCFEKERGGDSTSALRTVEGGDAILKRWSVLIEKMTPEQRFDVGRKFVMQISM